MNSVFAKQRWKNSIENVQTITAPRFTVTYSARPHKHVMSLSHIWTRTYYIVMMTIQSMSFSDVITKSERWWRLWQKQSLTGDTHTHTWQFLLQWVNTHKATQSHTQKQEGNKKSAAKHKRKCYLCHIKGSCFFVFFIKGLVGDWSLLNQNYRK